MATHVASPEEHSSDTTLTRAVRSYAKLQRAAYLADTIEALEELRARLTPAIRPASIERLARLEHLIEFYRGERRTLARELGLQGEGQS